MNPLQEMEMSRMNIQNTQLPEGRALPDFLASRLPGVSESRLPDKELRTAAPDGVPGKCKHEPEMTCAPVLGIPMSNTHSHMPHP